MTTESTVYPRVGGGTLVPDGGEPVNWGLSPRGRGNHNLPDKHQQRIRSIPAWAGEPADGVGLRP